MLEQAGAPARADAGDVLEPAGLARLLATPAMAGNREAVGLVADLLDQLQTRRLRARADLAPVGEDQRLVPGPAFLALRHAHHRHAGNAQLRDHVPGLRQLPGAA